MPKTITYQDLLVKLQETGLHLNEAKQNGQTTVPIGDYETLLNWFVESIRSAGEQFEQLGELFKEADKHKLNSNLYNG